MAWLSPVYLADVVFTTELVLLLIRVYAIWNRERRVLIFMSVAFATSYVVYAYGIVVLLTNMAGEAIRKHLLILRL